MGDAFFDAEVLGFVPVVPAAEFREGKEEGDEGKEDGCIAAGGGALGVGCFGFGWGRLDWLP